MSLADALITIFILVLITGLLIGIYFAYTNFFLIEFSYKNLSTNNVIGLNKMSSAIRSATQVMETKVINSTSYTTDSDTLILELPSVDINQIIIPDTYDYVVYQRDQTDAKKIISNTEIASGSSRPSGTQLVSENTETLRFNFNYANIPSTNKVEIILATSQQVKNYNAQLGSQISIKLRNK